MRAFDRVCWRKHGSYSRQLSWNRWWERLSGTLPATPVGQVPVQCPAG